MMHLLFVCILENLKARGSFTMIIEANYFLFPKQLIHTLIIVMKLPHFLFGSFPKTGLQAG